MMSIYDVDDGRHFTNQFNDYSIELGTHYIATKNELVPPFRDFIVKKIFELTTVLDDQVLDLSAKDISIYTGLSGIAYFYFNLTQSKFTEIQNLSKKCTGQGERLIQRSLQHLRNRRGSFICDDTGPLAMSVLLNMKPDNTELILSMTDYVVNDTQIPDEMLYGRCGYLYALLLLRKHKDGVAHRQIKKVFKAIIKSGRSLSKARAEEMNAIPPLFYEWHQKAYLGAAHGMTGIMFMLMQVYLDPSLARIQSDLQADIMDLVQPTVKFLADLRLQSGNYPSSLGESSSRDTLVHWCHGAPGWVYMFIAAHKIFKDQIYLDRAKEIGDVVWKRGLLNKGCGICHGSAGSGYALLAIYNYTGEVKYFYRAIRFAEWCTDYFRNRVREADRPYSLFEGLAGTLNFLLDCLDPKSAKFPAFEI